jgi:hypothetical protein
MARKPSRALELKEREAQATASATHARRTWSIPAGVVFRARSSRAV